MKYNLTNGCLIPIKKITNAGNTITNPPDTLLDQLGIGYYLETTTQPEYDPETQYVTKSYSIIDGKIKEVWTIHEFPVTPTNPTASSSELVENLTALGITSFATEDDLVDNLTALGVTDYTKE